MKKKLLIIVGAGASVDFGMPSVWAVDELLDDLAMKEFALISNPASNLYRHFRDRISAYYERQPKPSLRHQVNFEEVIYQLNLLAPYVSDEAFRHGSNALLTPPSLPDVMRFGHPAVADGHLLRTLSAVLLDTIVGEFITRCDALTTSKVAELALLTRFLDALTAEFEIGIVTLNYDNVFELAAPGLHTGFNKKGTFDPKSVFLRKKWGFIYHMHGSIHFAMTGSRHHMHSITWCDSPTRSHATEAFGRSSQSSMEGTDYPTSTIIAGYGKAQQIQRQPFLTYYAQLSRLANDADSLLFLGYGFSDLHLNSAFAEARGRRRPTVVVDFANDNQDNLAFRNDAWSYNLGKTIDLGSKGTFTAPGRTSHSLVQELRAAKEFEVSPDPDTPVAIWYNGFLEACRNPTKVVSQLL